MSTLVLDVVHMFSARGISAVPIVDEDGIVVNLYETVDVIVSDIGSTPYEIVGLTMFRPSSGTDNTSHWT